MRGRRSFRGPPGFNTCLWLALVLHAGVLGLLIEARPHSQASGAPPPQATWLPIELELAGLLPGTASVEPSTDDEPYPATAGVAADTSNQALETRALLARAARANRALETPDGDQGALLGLERGAVEPAAPARGARQRVSLDALGLGSESPLLGARIRGSKARAQATARPLSQAEAQAALAQSLADARFRADQRLGLGPESPILAQVIELARLDSTSANSNARLDIAVDAVGRVIAVRFVDSSTDPVAWRRIARSLVERLRKVRMRAPGQGRAATLRVNVSVRAQLPSGADPGLAVNVAGLELKKGKGPRSSRVDILHVDPLALTDPERGSPISIFGVRGDLVDIGAPVLKVARAHVESVRLHPLP